MMTVCTQPWRPGALLALFACSSAAAAGSDCPALLKQHLASDMGLSYEAFDQTTGMGFRALAAQGCDAEAVALIKAYIETTGAPESSLRWHLAQLSANLGETEEAIRYARSVLRAEEDFAEFPLRWNDYVLATIAFLERDMASLQRHRDRVAEGADAYAGNALNLRLLDALIEHFDRDYAYATSHIRE